MKLQKFKRQFSELIQFPLNKFHPLVWVNGNPEIEKGVYIGGLSTNSKIKIQPIGFYEIVEKPTTGKFKEYFVNKYYQEALGSYEHAYSVDKCLYFENKLKHPLNSIT